MIEGHREILGSNGQKNRSNPESNYGEDGMDIGDVDVKVPQRQSSRSMEPSRTGDDNTPKHPLRIDMRNNNPSREALESLLESVDFTNGASK